MAIIDGRIPEPIGAAAQLRPRIVVKFRDDVAMERALQSAAARGASAWRDLARDYGDLVLTPYIADLPDRPGARAQGAATAARQRLLSYFLVEAPLGADADALARRMREADDVETAYVEPPPAPPPVNAADDPRSVNQGYLDAAPNGIDARWAWSRGDGSGVGFVDLEQGWTLNHEDLTAAGITIIDGVSLAYHGHGTAVLGQVVGVDNTIGVVGIAPSASARVVSQWQTSSSASTAQAIVNAAAAMSAGDVLLLEAQTTHPNAAGYVPVEVYAAEFDAIRDAVDAGIVVVEAGGNGSVDLDTFTDFAGKRVLTRGHADFRDSGAIMVGAAQSPGSAPARARSYFSNFGSRIDCFGWGDAINTCGDGWTGTATNTYTTSFGGTSGASPIVSGAALILQSWARKGAGTYTPDAMRSLLSAAATNTPSHNPAVDRIGVMPDLRNIISAEEARFKAPFLKWVYVAYILFGVTQDGGGVVFIPGKGPVPIDPWGPLIRMDLVSPGVRDALASLAVHEIAELVSDDAARSALRRVAMGSVKRAADRMLVESARRG